MKLTNEQINFISDDIKNKGIKSEEIRESLLDHICCMIEQSEQTDFLKAYTEIYLSFGKDGLKNIEKETIKLLTKKQTNMKKSMYLIGFLSFFMSTTGILFKLQHWPFSGIILVLGVLLLNFGFLPMYFYDRYRKAIS